MCKINIKLTTCDLGLSDFVIFKVAHYQKLFTQNLWQQSLVHLRDLTGVTSPEYCSMW